MWCVRSQASDLLLKMHFTTVDVEKLKEWLKKWPFGTSKDGFGLPKTMLPMQAAVHPPGVKISFKGTPDPWLQVLISPKTASAIPHTLPPPFLIVPISSPLRIPTRSSTWRATCSSSTATR